MQKELLEYVAGLSAEQLLQLICEAKSGREDIYRRYLPRYTKWETKKQLQWFIEMAEEGALLRPPKTKK